jgi:apolipoprotein N-acyltransferase
MAGSTLERELCSPFLKPAQLIGVLSLYLVVIIHAVVCSDCARNGGRREQGVNLFVALHFVFLIHIYLGRSHAQTIQAQSVYMSLIEASYVDRKKFLNCS